MWKYIYLDTNVFSLIAEDSAIRKNFTSWVTQDKLKIVISEVTVDELSQKKSKFSLFNKFINNKKINILFLGAYCRISQLEIDNYPNNVDIECISMNQSINAVLNGKPFNFNNLIESKNFNSSIQKRNSIARNNFKQIVDKWRNKNPPDDNNSYSKQQQSKLRNKIIENVKSDLSKKCNDYNLNLSKFKTRMIIIESLIRKYLFNYSRNFDPNDFKDITHIAYSPYMHYFITEKNNFDVCNQIKRKTDLLKNTKLSFIY